MSYPRLTDHQIEVLMAYDAAGAYEGVATEFGDIWTMMGWEDRINSTLAMRNFDRAVAVLDRLGLTRLVDETYPELTAEGRRVVEIYREARKVKLDAFEQRYRPERA